MEITNRKIENAIKRKFLKPLNSGCNYNISKLTNERRVKHRETINLLIQSNSTLKNVEFSLKNNHLVDSNTLLRSAMENIMMAMVIQFDENIYSKFIDLDMQDESRIKINKLIDRFRIHLNDISGDLFEVFNRNEKKEILTELYDKFCNFTHSSIIVSAMIEVKSEKEKEILKLLMYYNYYFLKLLLFCCLKYFTNDKIHYISSNSIFFSNLFFMVNIDDKINKSKTDFSKYNDYLYYEKNVRYFKKSHDKSKKLHNKVLELSDTINDNNEIFINNLKEFLN